MLGDAQIILRYFADRKCNDVRPMVVDYGILKSPRLSIAKNIWPTWDYSVLHIFKVHNFTSISQISSSDYLQRIYGCSHVFTKWNSKSTSTVLPSVTIDAADQQKETNRPQLVHCRCTPEEVDSSERRSCGSQTCTYRPKLEREDSYLLLQMVGYPKRSLVEDRQEGPKPVTSTSTRANNSHLDEEKMKATMKENTQLKNEVQELKMKFERYEKSSIRPSILPSDLLLFLCREVVLDIENLSDLLDSFAFDHGRKSLDQYLHQLTYPQIVCRLAECTLQYSRIFASVLPSTLSNGMIESSPKPASSTTNLTVCDSTATDFATTNSSPSLALSLTIFSPSLTPEEDMMADDFSGKCVDGFIIEVAMHRFLAPLGSTKSHLDLDS
nr:uncharacterized protein LOC109177058 [Ipomoea batatas]